ncbi:MAG: 2-oxo-tetronate isomerase [Pseudomonadota bacterium]
MPKFCANLSMMFTEHPFLDRFGAAAEAGFKGVEFLFPYDQDAKAIRAELDKHKLFPVLFNSPPGDWEAGERGMAAVPGRNPEFRASFQQATTYAAIIRPGRLHVMAGNAAGRGAQAAFMENLAWAAEQVPNQLLCIEPINSRDLPAYFLNRSDQAIAVIEAIGAPNIGLQYDLYHAQISEGDLTRRLEKLIPYIFHIQLAGVPDRQEPDQGELNISHIFKVLEDLGYQGWIGCEYRPKGKTEDGLGWFKALN